MKVLLATTFYPPEGKAGTEVYTKTLADELYQQGHEVEVVCITGWATGPKYWNGVQEDRVDGVHVYRLALNWQRATMPNHSLFDNPMIADWFRERLQEFQPDIIHVISCLTLSASIVSVAKSLDKPVFITLMDFWFICPRHTLLRYDHMLCDGRTTNHECLKCLTAGTKVFRWPTRLISEGTVLKLLDQISHHARVTALPGMRGLVLDMERRRQVLQDALKQADQVISHSHFLADTFRTAGVDVPIEVLPNGHTLGKIREYIAHPERSRCLRFGTLSHAAEIKSIHLAVEAFGGLVADYNVELWIYGGIDVSTDYGRRLVARISENPRIQIKGMYQRSDLEDVLSQLDVVIVPSQWYENAPLTIYEAFAAGKPVIASNLGGMAEAITHDVNGFLFDVGDAQSLYQQMLRLIREPDLLDQLRRGIPPVRTASDEVIQLVARYQRALGTSAAGRPQRKVPTSCE